MKNLIYSLFFLLSVLSFGKSPVVTSGPEVDGIKKYIENLFESSKKVNLPNSEKDKARREIDGAIDWESIASLCLGPEHTKKFKGKNFSDFKSLLREVISKTAFSRMDKFWEGGTKAQINKVEVNGNQAFVAAKFLVKEDSFGLDYYLSKKGNQWLISDIAYEELKYSANIREQLDAFLKEKSFSDLLTKLRKRSEELDKPVKTKSS